MRVRWGFRLAVWLFAGTWAASAQTPSTQNTPAPAAAPASAAEAPLRTYGVSLLGVPSLPPDFKFSRL